MANYRLTCPFCKTLVETAGAERAQVVCGTCGRACAPPLALNVEYGWFFTDDRNKVGPVSWEYLQQRVKTGLLQPSAMIRQEGNQKWQEARSVTGLFPAPTHSSSLNKKWVWRAGCAALFLCAVVLLVRQPASRNRTNKARPASAPQVASKSEAPGNLAAGLGRRERAPDKTRTPGPVPATTGFVPRTTPVSPAAAADMKRAIRRYLFDRTGKSAAGTITPVDTPWALCAGQYLREKNFRELYGLIDEHLRVADNKYLASADRETRRQGLGMAVSACRCATFQLKDKWLFFLEESLKKGENGQYPTMEIAAEEARIRLARVLNDDAAAKEVLQKLDWKGKIAHPQGEKLFPPRYGRKDLRGAP